MNTLKMISLKSFLKYKICILIIVFVSITIGSNNMEYEIKAREPNFIYNNPKEFVESLTNCVLWIQKDTTKWRDVPREILIAQAVVESDYGRSRFAKEGNNLFGVMTFDLNKPHLKPEGVKNSKFGAKVYQNKCQSVKDYINVLNTGFAFSQFREIRFQMLINDNLDVLVLVETLKRYATNPNYVKLLKKTIKHLRNERISNTN